MTRFLGELGTKNVRRKVLQGASETPFSPLLTGRNQSREDSLITRHIGGRQRGSNSNPYKKMIADTPSQIFAYKLLALKGALKLETLGLRHSSGKSVAPQIRYLIGSRTKNKKALLDQYVTFLQNHSIL